jgi:tetratricopeptide (TPR) repeat protein
MPTVIPWENEEEQNYICMGKIVNDVMSKELRKIFKQEWNTRHPSAVWDDTNRSGQQLFNQEKKRSRPNKNLHQTKFQLGDTNLWDCSVLFDAILYSNSIGSAGLNPAVKTEVNNLREIRNEIMHNTVGKLSSIEFQNMTGRVESAFTNLGLRINEITQIKLQKNRYKSFQVLPPKPAHEVISRSEKIKQICEELTELRSDNDGKLTYFYISGNPGSGKSQLARQVCEDITKGVDWQTEATFMMTLDGKDLDSLLYSYEDFCRRLNCNESVLENIVNSTKPTVQKIKDLRSQVTTRIKNWKRWLIIVDNVENLQNIAPLLPQIGDEVWNNGQILLTTQNKTSVPPDGSFNKRLSLSLGMHVEECRQLLEALSRTDADQPLLDKVAEELDRQPLAMAAAAVYINQTIEPDRSSELSWHDYLEKIEKGKTKFAEERLRQVNPAYSRTMSAAVFLAVEKCSQSDIILDHVFHLFSLVSFEPMPLDLIVQYVQLQDKELNAEDIRLSIKNCSLLLYPGNEDCDIRLHHVTHEAIKLFCRWKRSENHHFTSNQIANERSVLNAKSVVVTLSYFKDRADKVKLIPHLKAFHAEIKELFSGHGALYSLSRDFETAEISKIYLFFGKTLRYCCDFELSMEIQKSNLQIWKGSKEETLVSDVYAELGSLHKELGDLEQAIYYHQLALEIRKKNFGQHHLKVASSYNDLGIAHHKSDLEKAKNYYERALEIQEQQHSPNYVDIADSFNNLGIVCLNTGDLAKAEDYHQHALEIKIEQLGTDHVKVANSYNNLGLVYREAGKLEQAEDYFQRALEIRKEKLGPNHVKVANSYNNLGLVYLDTDELVKAKDYHEQALEIQKKHLGPNHTDVATSYSNLGILYRNMGELDKALDYHKLALQIENELLHPNRVKVADSYNNLGLVYNEKGEFAEAMKYYQQALEIRKEKLGPNHLKVATCYNNLGLVCRTVGELEKAKNYHGLALEIRKKQLTSNHSDVADSYHNLGIVCHRTKELAKAKDCYLQALEIRIEQLGPNHVKVANSFNNLGLAYHEAGELADAEDYYQFALNIRKEQLGPNHFMVADSYRSLGLLYHSSGKLEEAMKYLQWALEIQKEQLGPRHVGVADICDHFGMVYCDANEFWKAKNFYKRALEIRK